MKIQVATIPGRVVLNIELDGKDGFALTADEADALAEALHEAAIRAEDEANALVEDGP